MATKKLTADEVRRLKGKTSWKEVDALTDKEIRRAASTDPDSVLPTEEELKELKPARKRQRKKQDEGGQGERPEGIDRLGEDQVHGRRGDP